MNQPTRAQKRKIVVVGAGAVGSTFAYAMAQSGLSDEIVVVDKNEELARGQALDLVHGQPFFPTLSIRAGELDETADAQLVVVTAGAAQTPGQSRMDLIKKNAGIVGGIAGEVAGHGCPGTMIVVSNPVDVLTQVALHATGWDRSRVIGSGTVLDSARFRHLISLRCGVDVHNVHAYILGEHGDSEFAAWSMTHIAGMQVDQYCQGCEGHETWDQTRDEIEQSVRDSAYHIINYKGATHFGVGMALVRIAGAILRGQNSVLTVSTRLEGEYGLKDVCLSLPCVLDHGGVRNVVAADLPENERRALAHSAAVIREALDELESARTG